MAEPLERELNVVIKGNVAAANKTTYLYRGDKDIQLNISITDTDLKFKNGVGNVLALEEGGFCKVIIRKPSGELVKRDRVPIENGVMKFLIDEQLCDDLDEVGEHEMQIRLYTQDNDDSPRWTMPPFSNIVVQEPLGSFSGENDVFYGASNKTVYDTDFLKSLGRTFEEALDFELTVNAGVGKFVYFALPVDLGNPKFSVNGFTGGFGEVAVLQYARKKYKLYKSTNSGLGEITTRIY